MSHPKNSQADRLERMKLFLKNTREMPLLQAAVATVGINEALLTEGDRVYATAQDAVDTQDALEAELSKVRTELNTAREEAWKIYMIYVQVAQLRITVTRLWDLLELEGAREKGINEQMQQMRRFYKAAEDAEANAALIRYGIWEEDLELGRAALTKVDDLSAKEARTDALKQRATEAQTAALDAMDAWYDARMEEATFATRHDPQLMESLGKVVK